MIIQLLSCQEINEIILTINIPEIIDIPKSNIIKVINNESPKGFGQNHNFAFRFCSNEFFCVINPDISIASNPFNSLLMLMGNYQIGVCSPIVLSSNFEVEDSSRYFPTLKSLLRKFLFHDAGVFKSNNFNLSFFYPDWIGGMFMLFKADIYRNIFGFDERFFLYYEDVDICIRVWKSGFKVAIDRTSYIIHDARRDSHFKIKFFFLHMLSITKYFIKYGFNFKIKNSL